LDRKAARRLDPFCQYAMAATQPCCKIRHLTPKKLTIEEKENFG
jgi:hypothetical protein